MARYTEAIERIFEVTGRMGTEVVCRCKWHTDHGQPNLYVNEESGLYFCHRCGAKGHLAGLIEGELPAVDLDSIKRRLHAPSNTLQIYEENWLQQFDFPTDYWTNRGFSARTIKRFQLGYDPQTHKAIIPIRDSHGRLLGVIGRSVDDTKPKYLYPKGFKAGLQLFGSHLIRKGQYHRAALVEGPLDAVACWEARVPALALYGARLSDDQVRLIKALGLREVVTMTDNDAAGLDAVISIKEQLAGMPVLIAQYHPTWFNDRGKRPKDPAELNPSRRRAMFLGAVPWHKILV